MYLDKKFNDPSYEYSFLHIIKTNILLRFLIGFLATVTFMFLPGIPIAALLGFSLATPVSSILCGLPFVMLVIFSPEVFLRLHPMFGLYNSSKRQAMRRWLESDKEIPYKEFKSALKEATNDEAIIIESNIKEINAHQKEKVLKPAVKSAKVEYLIKDLEDKKKVATEMAENIKQINSEIRKLTV